MSRSPAPPRRPPARRATLLRAALVGAVALVGGWSSTALARCSVTLRADGNTAAIQRAMDKPGKRAPVVCLKPGIYKGARLIATRSCTLKRVGKGRVVFDAGGRGRVFTVMGDGFQVTLDGLTLTNGSSDEGGAAAVLGDSTLRLEDSWLTANQARRKGGAVWVKRGRLELVRVRVSGNKGRSGGAVYVEGGAAARIVSTLVSDNKNGAGDDAPLHVRAGGRLDLVSSTLAYNSGQGVFVATALGDKKPARLRIESTVLMGTPDAVRVHRQEASKADVSRSVLYGGIGFIALDLVSSRLLPVFNLTDTERYRPTFGSPAIGIGQCTDKDARRDVAGNKRPRTCTAGALESTKDEIRKTLAARKKAARDKEPAWEYPDE